MIDDSDNGGPKMIFGGKGWVAIHRGIRNHWLVGFGQPVRPLDPHRGAHSRAEAFIDLVMECRYEAGTVMNGGRKMEIRPGQLVGAVSWLAHRWNWSPQTVRTFLDKLEADGSISREAPGAKDNKQTGKQCTVISVSNYEEYQLGGREHQSANQHANNKQQTSKQQASNNNTKDNKGTREQESPPFPPAGGEPSQEADAKKRKRGITAAQTKLTDAAIDRWNEIAKRHGLGQVDARTDARRARLAKRLDDIGGLDRFVLALSAIERVPFLMGKVPPKPGQAPFKLDIDRLLQTDGNLGDVLAKLIDKAGDSNELVGPNGKRWGWWRGKEAEYRAMPLDYWRKLDADCKPNGTWPWWIMGAPPGHAECIMPAELVSERGYVEIYQGQITHH